jgi:serine/threonine protein kinase
MSLKGGQWAKGTSGEVTAIGNESSLDVASIPSSWLGTRTNGESGGSNTGGAKTASVVSPPGSTDDLTFHSNASVPCEALGRVTLTRRLGQGMFGQVYLGVVDANGKEVACKQMRLSIEDDPKCQRRDAIRKEVQIMLHLEHPHIVRYLAVSDSTQGDQAIVNVFLEYVCGGSLLGMLIKAGGPLPEATVRRVGVECLHGLKYLHENKIIHRDIKPANIMLDANESVKLADFGSLYQGQGTTAGGNGTVEGGTLTGTPCFMAPEAITTAAVRKSDIWSLAATLSQLVRDKLPWSSIRVSNSHQLLYQIATSKDVPEFGNEAYSSHYHDFMSKCFQREVDSRHTAEEALQHGWFEMQLT